MACVNLYRMQRLAQTENARSTLPAILLVPSTVHIGTSTSEVLSEVGHEVSGRAIASLQ
jgi:hypothetical protein